MERRVDLVMEAKVQSQSPGHAPFVPAIEIQLIGEHMRRAGDEEITNGAGWIAKQHARDGVARSRRRGGIVRERRVKVKSSERTLSWGTGGLADFTMADVDAEL